MISADKLREALEEMEIYAATHPNSHIRKYIADLRTASQAYLAILEGSDVVVPREPTEEMVNIGARILEWHDGAKKVYRAMIAQHGTRG